MSLFVSFGKATEDDEGDNHANLGVKDGAGEGGTDEKGEELNDVKITRRERPRPTVRKIIPPTPLILVSPAL